MAEPLAVWRITQDRYRDAAFTGEGARRHGGRFNSVGRPLVYTSESPALAVLDLMANLDTYGPGLLQHYVVISATVDVRHVRRLSPNSLPPDWRAFPHAPATRTIGDQWLDDEASLMLAVRSAVLPRAWNYLVNPAHPDFGALARTEPEALDVDPRILDAG